MLWSVLVVPAGQGMVANPMCRALPQTPSVVRGVLKPKSAQIKRVVYRYRRQCSRLTINHPWPMSADNFLRT